MKMSEDIRPVTYLKSRTADLLAQVNETKRPVIITQNGEARGVLQDTESYESMKAAIAILKLLVQGEEDIRRGDTTPHDEVFLRLEKRLKSAGKRHGHE
jgi:prevent-host-death family protein